MAHRGLQAFVLMGLLASVSVAEDAPAVAAFKAGDVPTYAELDRGESVRFELHDGTAHVIRLVDYTTTSADLLIDGAKQQIGYRPQNLPVEVSGMRVGVEITKAWSDAKRFSWFGLAKECRLFLSDASRPVMSGPEGVYPLSPPAKIASGTIWGGGWLSERREGQHDCHIGFDVYGPLGTRVVAIEDVTVDDVSVNRDYGDMIVVNLTGKRFRYSYLHLSEAHVKKGDRLKAGGEVGLIGQTGYCAYPHLHVMMMLPGPAPADDEGGKDGFVREGRGTNVNPGPFIHDMHARLDPAGLVDYNKVTLKAVGEDGAPAGLVRLWVKGPDGSTWNVGVHDSTSVPAGKGPFTFIAERKRDNLRGETTAAIEKSGQEVVIVLKKVPETPAPPAP